MLKRLVKANLLSNIRKSLGGELEKNRVLLGNQLARTVRQAKFRNLQEAEFTVFSQGGEDGVIQYLLGRIGPVEESFVEFGVESYEESNTRFLLVNDNWRGFIIDGGRSHFRFLEESGLCWRHSIDARSAFVTKENINDLFESMGVPAEIGLLSIDIDGNDYWVLEEIKHTSPAILVAEYNSLWGPKEALSVPYNSVFQRTRAHFSNLYWGASLPALTLAAKRKNL